MKNKKSKKSTASTKKPSSLITKKATTESEQTVKDLAAKTEKPAVVSLKSNSSVAKRIEIEKSVDGQGVSVAIKDDSFITRKSSRYGITPSIFYSPQTNFNQTIDKINSVKSHNPLYLTKAAKNAKEKAKIVAKEAVWQFDHDIERIKLVTNKNLEIARVEALRIISKALLIEKNHHEQTYEVKCHEESLKNIALLKEARALLNDSELLELLTILKHDYELELKNNEIDYKRAQIKIEELQAIFQIKRKLIREQIKEINQGKTFNFWTKFRGRITPSNLIKEIKANKAIPNYIETETEFSSINELSNVVKSVDVKKLPPAQLKLWERFTSLIKFLESEDKYVDKFIDVQIQLDELALEVKEIKKNCISSAKKVVMLDEQSTKAIVDARKESLIISIPACLYAINVKHGTEKTVLSKNVVRNTKTIVADLPEKINPSIVRQPVSKLNRVSTDLLIQKEALQRSNLQKEGLQWSTPEYLAPLSFFDDELIDSQALSTKTLSKQMSKFQKLQNSDFSNLEHLPLETLEYVNYKWEWKSKADANRKSVIDNYFTDIEYKNIEEEAANKTVDFKQLFKNKDEKNIIRLKELIEHLPTDPIIVSNKETFKQENLNVEKLIAKFRSLSEKEILENTENEQLIDDIETILKIYNELVAKDVKYRKGLLKAQLFDRELADLIKLQDDKINALVKEENARYQQVKTAIENRYQLDLTNAKNQYLIRKELIIDQEQASYAKEEQNYLWNSFAYYKVTNNLMNQESRFENRIISDIIAKITKFNKHSNNPISLNNIPSKILSLPVHSNARIDISFDTIGSSKYIVAQNTDHDNKLLTKYSDSVDVSKIEKIYVLDKFRAVKDVKTRVALLTEYAKNQYASCLQANKAREAKEIKETHAKLEATLKYIDGIYQDAELLISANKLLTPLSHTAIETQNKYIIDKKTQWKAYDKDQRISQKIHIGEVKKGSALKKIELKNLKEVKSAERTISLDKKKTAVEPSIKLTPVVEKKAKTPAPKQIETNEVTPKNKKSHSFLKAISFQNAFRKSKKDEVSIDEIIGKK